MLSALTATYSSQGYQMNVYCLSFIQLTITITSLVAYRRIPV